MTAADPELEQRRGGRFACPNRFSSSVISSFFNPKLGGGGGRLSALFFVCSIRDNFIRLITCRVARGANNYVPVCMVGSRCVQILSHQPFLQLEITNLFSFSRLNSDHKIT